MTEYGTRNNQGPMDTNCPPLDRAALSDSGRMGAPTKGRFADVAMEYDMGAVSIEEVNTSLRGWTRVSEPEGVAEQRTLDNMSGSRGQET